MSYGGKFFFQEGKMAREIKPQYTTRAAAYELWMKAPNPMVTFFKTLDVKKLNRRTQQELRHMNSGESNGNIFQDAGCNEFSPHK